MANEPETSPDAAAVKAEGELQPSLQPLASLAEVSQRYKSPLPVESWNPPFCGDIDMKIAWDGTWYYQGSAIQRPAMVQLFSRLLRKDAERFVLVTPVECVGIQVEDAPFIATTFEVIDGVNGAELRFCTNVGDEVVASADHPLRFEQGEGDGLIPYVLVRAKLWARLTRALTFELVALGETQTVEGKDMFGISSAGAFFAIAPASDFA